MDIQVEETRKIYSVSELTRGIRYTLEDAFSAIWVEGEISGFTHHSSGHMYFTLKDADSNVSSVMFRRDNAKLRFKPEIGLKVICRGRISVYVPRGQYQFVVDGMEPKGLGDLQLAFEQLKKQLQKEGLFDESIKKPIPFLPETIGIITSPTGAVIRDIQNVLARRFPKNHIILRSTKVQGKGAAEDIAEAISEFNEYAKVDVLIVARGGGSLEDLWAFNEEVVARAIFESHIPVISAVGHEVDYTISDFVADMRAPTPSAAAELVLPAYDDLVYRVEELKKRLLGVLRQMPEEYWQRLDEAKKRLKIALKYSLDSKQQAFSASVGKLEILSPLASLARGYSITFDGGGQDIIKSTSKLKTGQAVRVQLADGSFSGKVVDISHGTK